MDGAVTTPRTRSPPIRPARPEVGVDNVSYGRPSAEYFTSVTATAQQAAPVADGRRSTDTTSKPRKRKSARYSIGNGAANGAEGAERKGSIRNAVRRLFGRKSRGDIPEVPAVPRIDAPRHGYHKSDPGHFKRPQTIQTHPSDAIHQRIISAPLSAPLAGPLSAPFRLQPPPSGNRDHSARSSPNHAVEFPKSARLKPLDLGNPFYTRDHGPKRRATLPSLIMTANEAADVTDTLRPATNTRAAGASFDNGERTEKKPGGLAVTNSRMDKRRSRSANDLKQAMVTAEPFRDRTGEIEYWRRSYASVLLSPTGKAPIYEYPPADPEFDVEHVPEVPDVPHVPEHFVREPELVSIPTPLSAHPLLPRSDAVSLPSTRGQSVPAKDPSPQLTVRSFSRPLTTPAMDTPTDLESRVAKLESHLIDFQRSLSNLALSSPSAIAPTEPPGSSHRQRTPSILVESLHTSNRGYEDAGDIMEREWGPSSHGSTNGDRSNLAPPTLRSTAATANGTFTALYNMLSEERSARRTLESQVRNLQHEVTRLQLSRGSWGSYTAQALPQGQRPRTPAESDGGRSASRQEAYNALSSPATVVPPASYLRAFDRPDARIQSRFSGDSGEDSEYGSRHRSAGVESGPRSIPRSSVRQTPPNFEHDRAAPPTPYAAYHTPAEERGAYRFSEDEMF
ncbi:hypothetical protein D6D17_03956 [Aureobasidium pullulans]|uniref:Uncharacterized protein n=1 Tax=Aureobasidium pullulans TaxID=5580 RepID=A0A4S9ZHY5_AURPU|nr:hypothetical protein D6D28_02242 [Aureobasidium pullulans]THW42880.1 hypothetical protein D6D22_04732 [Aureobasidium pullulans]THW44736.1 hypothetical protein D6D25_04470 [Aureobasidium pullulans]THW63516.1 hypothetical protein D6D20_03549 [Aureobasidium pullulans]THW92922.1 hypothetical protein D6D15_02800 [Aureobasidium pullulans]